MTAAGASGHALRALAPADLDQATAVLSAACAFDQAAPVAREKLFGPGPGHDTLALGVTAGARLAGVTAVSGPWLRLLAVHPDHRGHGLGTALLAAAERAITDTWDTWDTWAASGMTGPPTVRVMDQPGNYLAPGIDTRNQELIAWLARRGYAVRGDNVNLLVDVRENPRVSATRARALAAACTGYEIRRARRDQSDAPALRALAASFSPAWAFEVERALSPTGDPGGPGNPGGLPGVHVAIHRASGAPVAFAAHDGNNRGLGWFGPAGTQPAHRGQGLGAALLLACLADVAAAGHPTCEIAWIGPRDFYARVAGIAGERHFAVMRKEIAPS